MKAMTKKQFRHDFLRGLGSAIVELRSCGDPGRYFDIVKYGCLHDIAYDMQCEGARGWYLHTAAVLTGRAAEIEAAVLGRYARNFSDARLFEHLTALLCQFAWGGSTAARQALWDKYEFLIRKLTRSDRALNDNNMFESVCIRLISLDGWRAFKQIVEAIGEQLLPIDAADFFDGWFNGSMEFQFGKKRVEGYLSKRAEKSEWIRLYYEEVADRRVFHRPLDPPLTEAVARVTGKRNSGRRLAGFARSASPDDIEELARLAMAEPDPQRQAELLRGFEFRPYPFPLDYLWELTKNENVDLRRVAFERLAQSRTPAVREEALKRLDEGTDPEYACFLLISYFRREDETLVFNAIKALPLDRIDHHWLFGSVIDGIKKARFKPRTGLLEYVYRESLCGFCREYIVRLMHKKKVLPPAILEECNFDSYDNIRRFAERVLRARKLSKGDAQMVEQLLDEIWAAQPPGESARIEKNLAELYDDAGLPR